MVPGVLESLLQCLVSVDLEQISYKESLHMQMVYIALVRHTDCVVVLAVIGLEAHLAITGFTRFVVNPSEVKPTIST